MMKNIDCMNECCIHSSENDHYRFQGDFTKDNIMQCRHFIHSLWENTEPLRLDLGGITFCDSAFIALLIELKHDYPTIHYDNFSLRMNKLLDIYNINDFFAES